MPSHEEGGSPGNLLIPSKRPTDLYSSSSPWLTKPSEGASGHPVRMFFAGATTESRTLCVLRIACHPSSSNVDHLIREATTLAPSVGNFTFYFDSVTSKDGHTFPKSIIW
ncbi:hypothetical protein CK203_001272 [Vitis vinifera]|uniref:Uncharacterized protein n=1 Tax=Vitis vinifera TaxID=29760 RepID=A0A438KLH2_VITVI|nr:hypothetical protein CK203_001272 [Vitis vinifera]